MKRALMVLALMLAFVPIVFGATITYERVTMYTDGSAVPAAKVPTIQYKAYYGSSSTGPWTAGNVVTDNLAITAPDPPAGSTWWYTVTASLDGMESDKAVPASKAVPHQTPTPPPGCTVK